MSINYSTYVAQLSNLMSVQSSTTQFQTMLPGCIDNAEQRLYRDLDFLDTVVRDSSSTLVAGNRNFTLPNSIGTFVVVQGVNIVTPYTTTNPELGTRNELQRVSRDYLDYVWNSASGSTIPQFYSVIGQGQAQVGSFTIIVGPWPDQNYTAEIIGTVRPTPLSQTNANTILTQYVPDLFIAASMIFASGYMKNYGAQVDDPQQGMSWEQLYGKLLASAAAEELRKKCSGPGWTTLSDLATPPVR